MAAKSNEKKKTMQYQINIQMNIRANRCYQKDVGLLRIEL